MTLIRKRKLIANSLDGNDVVARVKKIYETMKKGVTDYNWTSSNDYELIVTCKEGQRWTVNIHDHTCECKKWMCSDYLTMAAYRKTYEEGVRPIPNSDDWLEPPHVCPPPPLKRPAGRPKKNRKRDSKEERPPGSNLRQKRKMKCSKCKCEGHNKATSKGPSAAQIAQRDGIDIETTRGRGKGRGRGQRITEPSQASGGNGIGQSIGGPSLASGGQNRPAAGQSAPDAGPRSQF
ncbi:hypothetical protein IFM89_035625, partial [Coptis chinensis]